MLGLFATNVPVLSTKLKPELLMTVPPAVTLSNTTSFFVATVTLFPACSTAMLSPAINVTVSSGVICSTELPATAPVPVLSVVSFQPVFAIAFTASSWPPFTASLDPAATRPSVTPVILPVDASSLMLPDCTPVLSTETTVPVPALSLIDRLPALLKDNVSFRLYL